MTGCGIILSRLVIAGGIPSFSQGFLIENSKKVMSAVMVIYPKYEGAFPAGILGLIMRWNADKYQFTTMKQYGFRLDN